MAPWRPERLRPRYAPQLSSREPWLLSKGSDRGHAVRRAATHSVGTGHIFAVGPRALAPAVRRLRHGIRSFMACGGQLERHVREARSNVERRRTLCALPEPAIARPDSSDYLAPSFPR